MGGYQVPVNLEIRSDNMLDYPIIQIFFTFEIPKYPDSWDRYIFQYGYACRQNIQYAKKHHPMQVFLKMVHREKNARIFREIINLRSIAATISCKCSLTDHHYLKAMNRKGTEKIHFSNMMS